MQEALCWDELRLVEHDNDSQLCAQVDEAEACVCEALTIARQEKPFVDILKRHDVIVLARVGLQCCEDFSEHLWQWTESERRRFEPVTCLADLEGEVLAMLLVNRDVVVGIAEVDADRPKSVCESLANDVRGVHLERFYTQKLIEF